MENAVEVINPMAREIQNETSLFSDILLQKRSMRDGQG